jgi:hypothetical protein
VHISPGAVALALLPATAVLGVDPGGLSPFGPVKWLAVPTLVFAAVALLRGERRSVARGPMLAFGIFVVVVAVAAAVAVDPVYAWIGTPERHFGALTWLLCGMAFAGGQMLHDHEAAVVERVAIAVTAIVGMWVVAEVLGWEPIRLTGAGDRPVGPLGSSAFVGAATALLTPIAVGAALRAGDTRRVRWSAACAAGLGAFALVAAGSRAAWFGAFVAAAVTAVRLRPSRPVLARAAMAAAALVAVAFVTGVASRLPDAVAERDGGVRGRLDEWRIATRVIADRPILGVGPEGYRIAFGARVDDRYEQAHGRDPLPDRAHSSLLDVTATTGIAGLLAFAGLLVIVGRRVLRGAPGMSAGVIAYAAQSLFLFPLAEIDPVAWLLAGVVVGRVAPPGDRIALRVPAAMRAAAGALAAIALVAGVLDLAADRDARTTLAAIADGRLPAGDHAAELRPDAVRYRLVAARALESRGTPSGVDRALAHVRDALDVSPRDPLARSEEARLLLSRARLTRAGTDIAAARRALAALLDDDPRNAETLLRTGVAASLAGDDEAAERAWLAAERLAPRSAAASVDLALAYARAERWEDARAAARRALARDPGNERALDVLRRAGSSP